MSRTDPVRRSWLLLSLGSLVIVPVTLWGLGALWFQAPGGETMRLVLAAGWALFAASVLVRLWRRGSWRPVLSFGVVYLLLLVWWNTIQPQQHRVWAEDGARTLTGQVEGSMVRLTDVRNFDWHSRNEATVRWEQRSYDLDTLRSVDMGLSYWGMPSIAHTMVSFGFSDGRYLTFSVEIRREQGESFSTIGGFFKQFELSMIAAEESDVLKVRTNRRGEEVYLYRLAMSDAAMRKLFLDYVDKANQLAHVPSWYNTLTANCTTIVIDMIRGISGGLPLDVRVLLSGFLPEYVHSIGGMKAPDPVEVLRAGGHITDRALNASPTEPFSQAIRRGMPGVPVLPPAPPATGAGKSKPRP